MPHESERMKTLNRILSMVVASLLMASAMQASASNISGTIAYLRVDPYGHVWVALANGPLLCAGGISEAYVLISDANYEALRAGLFSNKTSHTSVQLNTTTNGGYCHLDSASFY
jgi:hypothetical protein